MHKILLIIKREYISRVKKRAFLLVTILMPLLFMGLIIFQAFLINGGLGDTKKVVVVDESARFEGKLKNSNSLHYFFSNASIDAVKKSFKDSGYDYVLYIPASLTGVQLLGEKKPGVMTSGKIEDMLTGVVKQQRLVEAGIDTAILAKAQKQVSVKSLQLTASGTKDSQSGVAYIVGFISGVLIYLTVLLYGIQVMRGVIEEKLSRIIEVIISSVRPFQLMMGKIIGVGLVGLTQFVLIIILTVVLSTVGTTIFVKNSLKTPESKTAQIKNMQAANGAAGTEAVNMESDEMPNILQIMDSVPLALIIGCFLFYFLAGYFLYSAVFAAVGSAVDSETETQQFMFPVTFPLLFTYMISFTYIINNPDSALSVWLSIIPFTSPIAMMVRLPFGVPAWQLALSMLVMVGGFMFTIWAAARIYRVGILMYGKKASYKELAKWFTYKE